jgi:hypothetical protein
MKWRTFNPIHLAGKGIVAALDTMGDHDPSEQAQPPASALAHSAAPQNTPSQPGIPAVLDETGQALDAAPVSSGIWIDASHMMAGGAATAQTEAFRRIVNSFDEDRQDKLAWLVGKVFMMLAYMLPPLLGWYAGAALGDALTGAFSLAHANNVFIHLISISLELGVPMIGYAVATTFKRAARDRNQVSKCAVLLLVFLVVALGSAVTQDVLLYSPLPQTTLGQQVAVWFRSFGPSIVDILSAVFLSVIGVKNLKKYLADQREKIAAVREVNQVHIEMDKTTLQAAIDQQNALQDMQSKAKRAQTWNKIEEMQSEAMIEQARRNMLGDGRDGGGYRRSRY